jgi:hypothetical protein
MTEKKKHEGPGRPRLHADTKLLVVRVPVRVHDILVAAIVTIKMMEQDVRMPTPMVLVEALKARLKQLSNRNPERVERMLRGLDRALESYEHVEPLAKRNAAKRRKQHGLDT